MADQNVFEQLAANGNNPDAINGGQSQPPAAAPNSAPTAAPPSAAPAQAPNIFDQLAANGNNPDALQPKAAPKPSLWDRVKTDASQLWDYAHGGSSGALTIASGGASAPPVTDQPAPNGTMGASNVPDAQKGVDYGKQTGIGIAKSAAQTVKTIANIATGSDNIIGQDASDKIDEALKPSNDGQQMGATLETIAEFAAGDEALKGLSLGEKFASTGKVIKFMEANPRIATALVQGIRGAAVGGTVGGIHGGTEGAETGAEIGGVGGAIAGGLLPEDAPVGTPDSTPDVAVPDANAGTEPSLIQKAIQKPEAAGETASSSAAQNVIRAQVPGMEEGGSLRTVNGGGIDTTTPLADAKSFYGQVDEALPGQDFKGLHDKLDAAEDRARLTAPGSAEEAKAESDIKSVQDAIDEARKTAADSDVDVDELLKKADAKYQEAQANKDLNKKLFDNPNVVKGNLAHGAPESLNVDNAIDELEKLDAPNKFGKSRLQQTSLGKQGAFKLKQGLYDAQKAGTKAVTRQKLIGYVGKGLATALGLEVVNKVVQAVSGH